MRRANHGVFRHLLAGALFLLSVATAADSLAKAFVTDVRIAEHSETTRLVLEMSEKLAYTVAVRNNPDRLVIVLPPVNWDPTFLQSHGAGLISDYRMGQSDGAMSRILVDLRHPAQIRTSALLPAKNGAGHRLVIDIMRADFVENLETVPEIGGSGADIVNRFQPVKKPLDDMLQQTSLGDLASEPDEQEQSPETRAETVPETRAETENDGVETRVAMLGKIPLPPRKPEKFSKKVIVIDAGHGGDDSGAIGHSGLQEKVVTLSIARLLADSLRASGRYVVNLTRKDDRYLPLRQRVHLARKHNADLFISIHADWTRRRSASGLSVYTLSERASDREAAALAVRENKADIITGMDLSHENKDVSSILIDLAQRQTMNRSSRLAEFVVGEMRKRVEVLQRTHRFAGFAVLKAPDIPSILVETGFLSNRSDEKKLRSKKYQIRLVKGIHEAIDAYFKELENWGS